MQKLCHLAASLTIVSSSLPATPMITEFAAINDGSQVDGDGGYPDWIELHNPDPMPVDLTGFHLTDNPGIPAKYTFPAGTTIPAGGFLLVFASGQADSSYIDAGGFRHTNFSLNAGGEYLALNEPGGSLLHAFSPEYPDQVGGFSYGIGTSAAVSSLLEEGATSTWWVPSSDIGNDWQMADFDDAGWTSASTGIGYGYDEGIGAGGDTKGAMWFSSASVYLRVPFQVNDPSSFSSLALHMRYEDGFVAYLNGVRIASANAPDEDSLAYNSTATAEHPDEEAIVAETFTFAPSALVAGTNILAIHGLNLSSSGSNSNDFLIIPELEGTSSSTTGSSGYFATPTPGSSNAPVPLLGFVADTKFSHDRGYHTESFDLEITSATPGAAIFYTTDGTPPSPENGTRYTTSINISSTTTIRAMAARDGFEPTNIDTQTYLFIDDIIRQTRPSGYPSSWGGVAADYDMDAEIVDHPDYADQFNTAFAALPSLSLVFDPDAFFHPSTGIYQRPGSQGMAWERPLSAELMVPDSSEKGFQINAGVRIQGGSSRNTDTPKHSLSLRFRSDYGKPKLNYPLFKNTPNGDSAIEEFDLLQLRPEYNYGWMHRHWYQCDHALYGRDQWASDLFVAMGQNGSHGRWVHLFLNGIYWGLYDLHERPDADHMANYFGGSQEDYDTVNSSQTTNGDLGAYNTMMNLAYGSIQTQGTYESIQEYLDLDAFADYMILNAYVGNRDWDGHNWRAGRKREAGAPYLFFPWDTEFAVSHVSGGVFPTPPNFFTTALSTDVTGRNGNRRPTGLQTRLQLNAEYRLRYADRVHKHFFNDGPLVPANSSSFWTARSASMHDAIVAESARWGDHRRDMNSGRWSSSDFDLYTRDEHYLPVHDWLVDTYIPQRSAIVLNQLRNRNLYPDTDAPVFSPHGGTIPRGLTVPVSAPSTVYYTTDGSDPRLTGGAVSPTATSLTPGTSLTLNESTLLRARTRAGNGEWSALNEATFTVDASNLMITEIMYHPADQPRAEFLELTNTGEFEISLTGLYFSQGISFNFDDHSSISSLAPGARLLIVRDLAAFQLVYGNSFDALVAGTFQEGTALNNGGESLAISDANDNLILFVDYRDDAPWPGEADGSGNSLVFAGGDPALAPNWRPSSLANGNPGSSDSTSFPGGSLIDYALASTPVLSGTTFIWTTPLTADDVVFEVQHSPDLNAWTTIESSIQSQTLNAGDSTRTFTIEVPAGLRGYARVIVRTR